MRLYQTLHTTVKWKWITFWYVIWIGFVFYTMPTVHPLMTILGLLGVNGFAFFIVMGIFGKVVHKTHERWPVIWSFRTIFEKPIIYDSVEGYQGRFWCEANLNGNWIHCQHGYFVFQRKDEAMAFKLVWTK